MRRTNVYTQSPTQQLIVGTLIGPNLYQTQYAVVHICTTLSISDAPHGTYMYQHIANVCYCNDYIFCRDSTVQVGNQLFFLPGC